MEGVEVKTSSFFKYDGPGRISIARSNPRGGKIRGYRRYPRLAPEYTMLKMARARYEEIYFGRILAAMDPQQTWDVLHRLAAGDEPVLLCYEDLDVEGQWCHRRMVARWFEQNLGFEVPEMVIVKPEAPPKPQLALELE
jgi:hypothetical protein